MAESKDEQRRMPPSQQQVTEAQRISNALAEASDEAEKRQADETVPGGRYRTADGRLVDANGKTLKDED